MRHGLMGMTLFLLAWPGMVSGQEKSAGRIYSNILRKIEAPTPILADHPEFFEPVVEEQRFEADSIVDDPIGDLHVRAWRFSYNARGIIEMPNRLRGDQTAIIMVHPWAIDDSWGWKTPQPQGVADFCTPTKNHLASRHSREVIDPFLKRLRQKVSLVMYSLPGPADPIRTMVYRSFESTPSEAQREEGRRRLRERLAGL